jgi:hypothetical protein
MRKLILGALLLLSTLSFGQDTIFSKNFTIIIGEVYSYNRYFVGIQEFDNEDDLIGITKEISTDLIDSVKFLNGKVFIPKNFSQFIADIPLIDNYDNKKPGDELKLYTKHFYTGTALTLAGGAILSISSAVAITNGTDPTPGLVIGSLISIVGAGFIIESPIHIKRAGIILNENGVGIKVKL